jgi:cytidyltransferase-like protein
MFNLEKWRSFQLAVGVGCTWNFFQQRAHKFLRPVNSIMFTVNKGKIRDLAELSPIVNKLKKNGKTIGLITGCFDLVHINHIALFKNTKERVDILIVGLENDKTIKRSKGTHRPINKQENRLLFLSAITYVDYVFLIDAVYNYTNSALARKHHKTIVQTLSPNFLITNKRNDKSWESKSLLLRGTDIKLLNIEDKREEVTTSVIEQRLLSET